MSPARCLHSKVSIALFCSQRLCRPSNRVEESGKLPARCVNSLWGAYGLLITALLHRRHSAAVTAIMLMTHDSFLLPEALTHCRGKIVHEHTLQPVCPEVQNIDIQTLPARW